MGQEDSWEKLAVTGESDWREERYRQAEVALGRASDLALAALDLSLLPRYSTGYPLPTSLKDPAEGLDIKWLSRLARVLALLGSCRHHIGEISSAETAFQRSMVVLVYLIERRVSDSVGEIDAFADLLRQCGRADLAQAVSERMTAKVLEILG